MWDRGAYWYQRLPHSKFFCFDFLLLWGITTFHKDSTSILGWEEDGLDLHTGLVLELNLSWLEDPSWGPLWITFWHHAFRVWNKVHLWNGTLSMAMPILQLHFWIGIWSQWNLLEFFELKESSQAPRIPQARPELGPLGIPNRSKID